MNKCPILGCKFEFTNAEQAELHAASSWHCISCGMSDDTEVTIHNVATQCSSCANSTRKRIRVDFKRKAYVVGGRLSRRENGRWVHYE